MLKTDRKIQDIIHIDMDAFFASVEILDNPALKGKPVIVGGSNNRGVVCAASYNARSYGVHSAMPIATAMNLCPQGIFLPVRMERYREISQQVFSVFAQFTPMVEPVSIDEAFLDVTGSRKLFGTPDQIARKIRQRIRHEIGLTASAGVAATKFIAKIASDIDKPDGLTIVPHDQVHTFLNPLPIEKLWGVGIKNRAKLKLLGIHTIGELKELSPDILQKYFGKHGISLHNLSHGIDDRTVSTSSEIKSIGNEKTFEQDLLNIEQMHTELLALSTKVAQRMRSQHVKAKTIILKIKYFDFSQITRSTSINQATDDGSTIYRICCAALKKSAAGSMPVRLLGVTAVLPKITGGAQQLKLFPEVGGQVTSTRLNHAVDRINQRFGNSTVVYSEIMKKKKA